MLDIRCNLCGSNDVWTKSESIYNDEVKSVCLHCGVTAYGKSLEELPITIENVTRTKNHDTAIKVKARSARRKTWYTKAKRKQRIAKRIYGETGIYKNLHQYSKNKIHCSCPLCSAKYRDNHGLNLSIGALKRLGIGENRRVKDKLDKQLTAY